MPVSVELKQSWTNESRTRRSWYLRVLGKLRVKASFLFSVTLNLSESDIRDDTKYTRLPLTEK